MCIRDRPVTVLTPPDENEIKTKWRQGCIAEINRCELAKQGIEDLGRTGPPDHFEESKIQAKYKKQIDACRDQEILVKNQELTGKQENKKMRMQYRNTINAIY